MLRISEIRDAIPEAIDKMVAVLRLSDAQKSMLQSTPITICNRDNCRRIFDEAVERQAAFNSGYLPDTVAEVIYGYNGSEVLVYQHRIHSLSQLDYTLWHEWTHLLANEGSKDSLAELMKFHRRWRESGDPQFYDKLPADEKELFELLSYGSQLWGEFISDATSNFIKNEPIRSIAWDKQEQLKIMLRQAIAYEGIDQGLLGHYCAMVLTDPTISSRSEANPHFSIALEFLDDRMINEIVAILKILDEALCNKDIFDMPRETILSIGSHVNELWTIRYEMICRGVELVSNEER